jgi:hypothetical protein
VSFRLSARQLNEDTRVKDQQWAKERSDILRSRDDFKAQVSTPRTPRSWDLKFKFRIRNFKHNDAVLGRLHANPR